LPIQKRLSNFVLLKLHIFNLSSQPLITSYAIDCAFVRAEDAFTARTMRAFTKQILSLPKTEGFLRMKSKSALPLTAF